MFTRNTIRTEIFRIVEEHKQLLIVIFSSMPCKVSLTSDCWEALTGNHYICVTAHYIDSDWILQKRIIGFKFFSFFLQCIKSKSSYNESC